MLKYKVVAVDFDGTLTIKDEYQNVGELNPLAIHYLKEYKKAISTLHKLILIDDSNDDYFFELGV